MQNKKNNPSKKFFFKKKWHQNNIMHQNLCTFAHIFMTYFMDIQLFIPCYIDQLYPETGKNVWKVLEKAGCNIHYNPEQTCCGQPAFNSGYMDETAQLAKKFINDFSEQMPIVSPSGSCTGFMKLHYEQVLATNPAYLERFKNMKAKLFELTDFLVNQMHVTDFGAAFPHKVTYHDSCSALREYGIKKEPRALLSNVKGLELVEMEECESCCGFGGTFSVKFTDISTAMVEKKVRSALETGAEYIVTTEASCMMNINGYCTKQNLPIKAIHIADILASF